MSDPRFIWTWPRQVCHHFADEFELTIFQHWSRYWLGADQATSHCLNQWCIVNWRIHTSFGLNSEWLPTDNRIYHCTSNHASSHTFSRMSARWYCDKPDIFFFHLGLLWRSPYTLHKEYRSLICNETFHDNPNLKFKWIVLVRDEDGKWYSIFKIYMNQQD